MKTKKTHTTDKLIFLFMSSQRHNESQNTHAVDVNFFRKLIVLLFPQFSSLQKFYFTERKTFRVQNLFLAGKKKRSEWQDVMETNGESFYREKSFDFTFHFTDYAHPFPSFRIRWGYVFFVQLRNDLICIVIKIQTHTKL